MSRYSLTLTLYRMKDGVRKDLGLVRKKFDAESIAEANQEALATLKRNQDNNPGLDMLGDWSITRGEENG